MFSNTVYSMDSNSAEPMNNGFGGSSYDSCGYEIDAPLAVDTRNTKWQARQNGQFTAAANKSFNHKDYAKYMKRREAKIDRETQQANEKMIMKQIEADNKKWAPVDKDDARHLQKISKSK